MTSDVTEETLRSAVLTPMPRACADLPTTGGVFKSAPQDFEVEEVPAYEPSGSGEHLYLWLEKTDLPAFKLTQLVSRALQISERDIGCAGLKDAFAVTRQYLSVPAQCEERLGELDNHPQVRVLKTARHGNKLKTGHLWGNIFRIVLRDVGVGSLKTAQEVFARLEATGLANAYGPQRFGYQGHTAVLGAQILGLIATPGRPRAGRSAQRLALSALQSLVFNACLRQRMERGLMQTVLAGDVMQVRASGGPFVAEDVQREQPRLEAREIGLTGPMPGLKMRAAVGDALALEQEALSKLQLTWDHFATPNALMQGTRRPLTVWPQKVTVALCESSSLEINFLLPKGSFATAVLHELMGPEAMERQ